MVARRIGSESSAAKTAIDSEFNHPRCLPLDKDLLHET